MSIALVYVETAKFRVVPLRPIFRPRISKPNVFLLIKKNFQNMSGMCLNASVVVAASKLHVGMVGIIVQWIEFASPIGRTRFKNTHPKQFGSNISSSLKFCEFRGRTKFCSYNITGIEKTFNNFTYKYARCLQTYFKHVSHTTVTICELQI